MTRSLFFYLLMTMIFLSGCSQSLENSKPNIILILADDLGYNDLSCYRRAITQTAVQPPTSDTPNIDSLAEKGLRFTDFYCGAAVCSPSRSALLTGRNCTRVGIYNWIPPEQPMHLRSEEVTLAEILKPLGYQTAHFGKWHLTAEGMGQPLPTDQGYDDSFFTYNNANPSHRDPINFFKNGKEMGTLKGYASHLVVDEALEWLKSNKTNNKPFYINIWFNEPHQKVAAPNELTSRHSYNSDYYGCIENMDLAIGKVLLYLKEEGLEKDTIIIFTSDNGSQVLASNDPLRGEKTFNFEGGVRVPFLVQWDGKIPANKVSNAVGSFTDIVPTLASIVGFSLPNDRTLDGEDISTVFFDPFIGFRRNNPVFFFRYFHDPVCMLREGDWVLLGYAKEKLPYQADYDQGQLALLKPDPDKPGGSMWRFQERHMRFLEESVPGKFELFDLKTDISQRVDLSDEYPDIVVSMKRRMLELRSEMIHEGGNWYKAEESKK